MRKIIITLVVLLLLINISAAQVNESAAEKVLKSAQANLDRMMVAGFGVKVINQTLIEAKKAYADGYYGQTVQLSERINTASDDAFKTYAQITGAREDIDGKSASGLDMVDSLDLMELAQSEFDRENYAEAKRFVTEALAAAQVAEPVVIPTVKGYLTEHWMSLLAVALVIAVAIKIGYPKVELSRLSGKLESLRKEEKLVSDLIKETDKKYYEDGAIGKDEYEDARGEHEKRLADINETLAVIEAKLKAKTKGKTQ